MSWQPRRWAGGLLIPLALWLLAVPLKTPEISNDLSARTASALQDVGLTWARERGIAGRDVQLIGAAPAPDALEKAQHVAAAIWGVRRVDLTALVLIPEAKPYLWSAEKAAETVSLRGTAPTDEIKASLSQAAAAAFPGLKIVDETSLARGASPEFAEHVRTALADLKYLERGSVNLTDAGLTIRGEAPDFKSYDALAASLKSLPPSMQLLRAEIGPPRVSPFLWSASSRLGKVELAGVIPSDNVRAEISARITQIFPGAAVVDASRVAQGAPPGEWSEVARFALDRLAQMTQGEARLSDNRLTIAGIGKPGFGNAELAALARILPAGFVLAPGSIDPPEIKPYIVTIGKSGTAWRVDGYAPSEAARTLLLTNLRSAEASGISDTAYIATGLPQSMDYDAVTSFVISVLSKLENGEAKLVDTDLTISGNAPDRAAAASVASLLNGSLPAGLRLKAQEISQPKEQETAPYTWSASIAPGVLTLAGAYPDTKSHEEILERAARVFQGEKIVDEMKEARGASRHFMDAVFAALMKLSRVEKGEASIAGQRLAINGETLLGSSAEKLSQAASEGLPDGWSATVSIVPQQPQPEIGAAACQQALREVLKSGRIYFENGKADIDQDAYRLLDRLAVTVRRCPAARIEIGGHTDSDGSPAFNQDLSERRAYAVVDYLIRNGNIDSGRLSAVGYGLSKPVAPNDTEEGKARNRRIDFTVK